MKTTIHQILYPHLGKKEALLWSSKPLPFALPSAMNVLGILFQSFIFGYFFYLNHQLIFKSYCFKEIDLISISIGISATYLLFSTTLQLLAQSKTIYGITDKRIIIKKGIFSSIVRSIEIKSIQYMEILELKKNYGVLSLYLKDHSRHLTSIFTKKHRFSIYELQGIPEVVEVYHLISEVMSTKPST